MFLVFARAVEKFGIENSKFVDSRVNRLPNKIEYKKLKLKFFLR